MLDFESNLIFSAAAVYFAAMSAYFFYAASKKEISAKAATALLIVGALLHSLAIAARTMSAGRLPFANLYESMLSFSWGMVFIYLFVESRFKAGKLGVGVSPLIFLSTLYASTLNKQIEPLMPALKSNWLLAHVGVAILAYGSFAVSFGCALLWLLKEYFKIEWLPSQEKLDALTYKLIAFAMPFMTLVLVTGAVWAEQAWGGYWSWDPKETWSLITYLVYLSYLHVRLVLHKKGRITIWLALIGFLVVLFTYLGVNLFLSGLHSYA